MQTLYHLPLEKYQARYTEQLSDWEQAAFSKQFEVKRVESDSGVSLDIITGEVLDAVQRPVTALSQIAALLPVLRANPLRSRIWCSDFFHPGLEALPYSRVRFSAYSFLWAQTFDRFDFTNKFLPWMRSWEQMALDIYSKVFVASPLLKDLIVSAFPGVQDKIEVVGLPFDPVAVRSQLAIIPASKDIDVVWSSRFDTEKVPGFFLNLVEACPDLSFCICTGRPFLSGTDGESVDRALALAAKGGNLTIHSGLDKAQYYSLLSRAKAQFNCAKQDWVSFTLLEALTFDCVPVYPAARSFFYEFAAFPEYLYLEDDLRSAALKLYQATSPSKEAFASYQAMQASILSYHSRSLARISQAIYDDSEEN